MFLPRDLLCWSLELNSLAFYGHLMLLTSLIAVCTRKTRIIDTVYNASNNELVRTKTLVKNGIIQVDATPFRQWFEAHYALPLGRKKGVKLVSLKLSADLSRRHLIHDVANTVP